MGTGIIKGFKWFGKKLGGGLKAASPGRIAAQVVDRSVDSLKDDQFVIVGRTCFDLPTLSLMHEFRLMVEDKQDADGEPPA